MNIFNNNQANTNKNPFNTNQSSNQLSGQNTSVNIFANKNPNLTSTNNPQPAINIFTQQKPTQQQQQNQPQPTQPQIVSSLKSPSKTNPSQPIPTHPLIRDSLFQKYCFTDIHFKVVNHIKLTMEQINFVRHGGQIYFKKDGWKENYFKTVKSKENHLGFTKEEIIYQGDIPRCIQIEVIFSKIIKNFAFICNTNEMNGYFLIKRIIKSTKIYRKLYKPKPGLDNRVFEVNVNYLKTFYKQLLTSQQKPLVNQDGKTYLEILNQMITDYQKQWSAFISIVEIICCGHVMEQQEDDQLGRMGTQSRGRGSNQGQQQQQLGQRSAGQQQPLRPSQQRKRHLRFKDFYQTNILLSLFECYKQFSFKHYEQKSQKIEQISQARKRYLNMKKSTFFRISQLMSRILQSCYTQQMLMQKDPLPIIQVVNYIDDDIEIVHANSLIQPAYEQRYTKNGMNIILGIIPFAAFVNLQSSQLLRIYFNLQQTKSKYDKTLSRQYKRSMLKKLSQIKTPMFMPIKLWALTQIEETKVENKRNNRNRMQEGGSNMMNSGNQNQSIQLTTLWEQYLQRNIKDLTILQLKRWSYLVCTMILTLGIEKMLQSQFLKSILVYYTKNVLKNSAYRFFTLWGEILSLEKLVDYDQLQRLVVTQNKQQVKQSLVKMSKMIIGQLQFFVAGKVLKLFLQKNHVQESYKVMTKLLKDEENRQKNFTKELFEFVDAIKVDVEIIHEEQNKQLQEGKKPQQGNLIQQKPLTESTIRIKILISQLARHFRLPFFFMNSSQIASQIQVSMMVIPSHEMQVITSYEQEIKFLCRLIQVNYLNLWQIENKFFGDYGFVNNEKMIKQGQQHHPRHMENESNQLMNKTRGLKICIYLCLLIGKIDVQQVTNIKCVRYIIQTIDALFNYQQTNPIILLAISIVFPLGRQYSTINQNKKHSMILTGAENMNTSCYSKYTKSAQEVVGLYPLDRLLLLLTKQSMLDGYHRRQIQKLHHTISHHIHHLIQYSDSLDISFPANTQNYRYIRTNQSNKPISIHTIYERIQRQLQHWQFVTACQYMNSTQLIYRPSDWLYTFIKVLKVPKMLPIDIDTIILLINKMRIQTQQSPAFFPMMEISQKINEINILQQLLQSFKPTISISKKKNKRQQNQQQQLEQMKLYFQKKQTIKILNEHLTNYQPIQSYKQQKLPKHKYHKYENAKIIQWKNNKYALYEQGQIIKRLCMFARLIEEILKIKLEDQYSSYTLLARLNFIEQLYALIIDPQQIHTYNTTFIQKSQQKTETINLQSVIVSLLNLYDFQFILPMGIEAQRYYSSSNKPFYVLKNIEKWANFTFSFQKKYAQNLLTFNIAATSQKMYYCYQAQASILNGMFFDSVPYIPNDFGVENDETSLKSCIFSILQLLYEHNTGHLVTKCLQDFSYPIKKDNFPITYNPTLKYLKNDRSKSQFPLIFKHISSVFTIDYQLKVQSKRMQAIGRTLQSLSVLIKEDIFYCEIIKMLGVFRTIFPKLLTHEKFVTDSSQSTFVNVYNKMMLFSYQLVRSTINKHPQNLQVVVNNFLIQPTNLMRMMFQCLEKLIMNNINLKELLLVKSFQGIPNYFMQQRLTQISIYRATLDIMFRIILNIVEIANKQSLEQLLVWLFRFDIVIVQNPIDLKQQNLLLTKLNLVPLQVVMIRNEPLENIKTSIFSQQVSQYKYCYRTNIRKYGNNFMYPSHTAFHRLKVFYKTLIQNENQQNRAPYFHQLTTQQFVRRQLYHIQLINCLKSLRFSNDSMVKSYFQLMNLLSNTGSIGQNLFRYQIERQLPKLHEKNIMINKYCLKNQFSFYQALKKIKGSLSMNNSLAKIVHDHLDKLRYHAARIVQVQQNYFPHQPSRDEIRRKKQKQNLMLNAFQQLLQEKSIFCVNPDHIVKYTIQLLSVTFEHYQQQATLKLTQGINPLKQIIHRLLLNLLQNKIKCTLRVLLMSYETLLGMYDKIQTILKEKVMYFHVLPRINQRENQFMDGNQYKKNMKNSQSQPKLKNPQQQTQERNVDTQLHKEILNLKRQKIQVRYKILNFVAQKLFSCLQTQKPTYYLRQNPMFRQQSQLFGSSNSMGMMSQNNDRLMISSAPDQMVTSNQLKKAQLMENIPLVCSLCMSIIPSSNSRIDQQIEQEYFFQSPSLTQKVNYSLKLLMQNIQHINNPLSRILLFNLCNKFFFTHKQTLVEKWPFYDIQINVCDELFMGGMLNNNKNYHNDQDDNFGNDLENQEDPFWLEKINVIDTYCTVAIVNEKVFTKELLIVLVNVIKIDSKFIQRQKSLTQVSQRLQLSVRGKKKYNFRKFITTGMTLDRLIEHKKLMTAILLTFEQENWQNPNQSPLTNVLFLELLNFTAIQFSLQRLLPMRRVENRLKGLVVCEGQIEEKIRKMEEQKQFTKKKEKQQESIVTPNIPTSKSTKSLNKTTKDENNSLPLSNTGKSSAQKSKKDQQIILSKQKKPISNTSSQSSLSLFQFIAFVHHNELIYSWMLAIKIGLRHSSIMQQIGGYILETDDYNQIWTGMMAKINQLYHYYADYVEIFLENNTLIQNITKLYNYVAQQSAYMAEFNGLNAYFDVIEEDYVPIQLIRSIIEFCVMVMETVRKSRDIQWKCQRKWGKQRLTCINKCIQLIQKNKVIVAFRQFDMLSKEYNDLRQALYQEIQEEKNFDRQ